jgi:hypothetical protein
VRAAPPGSDPRGRRCIADALFCARTMWSSVVYVSGHNQEGTGCTSHPRGRKQAHGA